MKKGVRILFLLIVLIHISFISAAVVSDDLHLNIQTINSTGGIVTGTYDLVFNISNVSDCTNLTQIVYTNSTTLTTDSRGVISYYLPNVTLNYDEQYWLCYYRDGTLINNSKIAKTPYTFRSMKINMSGINVESNLFTSPYNITSPWFFGKVNASNVSNENWIEASSESTLDVNSSTWWSGITSWASGWFTETANALGFNETKLNNTIWDIAGNGTLANNVTIGDYIRAKNNSLATWVDSVNDTQKTWAEVKFATVDEPLWTDNFTKYNSSWSNTYNDTSNTTIGDYIRAKNDSLATWVLVVNDTQKDWADNKFVTLGGDTITGNYDFNGGWESEGLSIIDGDIYAQTGYFYNITGLSVNTLAVNGSIVPHSQFNNTFDLGNSSYWWRDLFLGRNAYVSGNLFVDGIELNDTINTYNTSMKSYVDAKDIVFNTTMGTYVVAKNNSLGTYVRAKNDSLATWVLAVNTSMYDWALNNITGVNTTMGTYVVSKNDTMGTYVRAKNDSLATWVLAVNTTQQAWADNKFLLNFGDTATGNYTFDSTTLFVDSLRDRIGIGTINPADKLTIWGNLNVTGGNSTFDETTLFVANNTNRVGIGTTTPMNLLNVLGNANITGTLTVDGIELNDTIEAFLGNGTFTSVINSSLMRNDGDTATGNYTFDATTLHIDSTSGRIGIGTATPQNLLNVLGNANITGELKVGTGNNFTLNQTGITFSDGSLQKIAAGGGAWEFVSGTSVTNLKFMNFTGLETGYDYSFSIQGAIPDIDAVTLETRFSQSSSWVAGTTDYEDGNPNSSISLIETGNTFGNATDEGFNMEVSLPEPNVGSRIKRVFATVAGSTAANNETQKGIAGGRLDVDTNAVDGISFYFSSGNWTANGKIYVFRKKLSVGAAVTITSSIWNDSGTNLYQSVLTRKVGINTTTPSHELNVLGDANVTRNLFVGTNITINQTGITFSDGSLQKIAAGGGAWQFVSGTSITNLKFMNFTGLETGYDYSFSIQGAIPAIDNVTLETRFSQSSSWVAGTTDYEDIAPNSSISLIGIGNTFGNATDEGFNMEVNLPEPNVGSRIKRVIATVIGSSGMNNESQKGIAGGRLDLNTDALDGISFYFSSGNWTANGKIYVFRKKLSAGPAITITSTIWNDSGTNIYPSVLTRKVGINTTTPSHELNVLGDANITRHLYVGGNLTFYTADYAESFESDVILEKGDVVCLDKENKISKCLIRADPSVIGAVSSDPSIIGRNIGFEKSYPVGFVGIVPVKVTGPVNRFELLTTSNKEGYAEKATIYDFGSIIGKSMGSCYEEECLIDVIVGLK